MKKKLNNENNESNANLDCEDGAESKKVKLLKKSEKAFTHKKKKAKQQNPKNS